MKKKKILIAHNNMRFIERLKAFYQDNELYTIKDYVTDGNKLLSLNTLDDFDIVIVKDALTEISGLYALDVLLQKTKQRPELIILITPFINSFIEKKCEDLNVVAVHNINITVNELNDMFYESELKKNITNKNYFDSQKEVINILKNIGLLKVYIGYTYFEYILNYLLESNESQFKTMKSIYGILSEHFKVSPYSVEKAMRTCIKSSLSKCDSFYAKMLFGHNADNYPSTSMFIQVCIKTLKELKASIIDKQFRKTMRSI